MPFTAERLHSTAIDAGGDVAAQILAASQARAFLDCNAGDTRITINADAIRAGCLLGASLEPFGVRIANALIEGELDLRAMTVDVPLHFVSCVFTHAPRFDGADLHELSITDGRFASCAPAVVLATSELPGLLANGVRIRRDLNLSGSLITGAHRVIASVTRSSAVWLTEAELGGRLLAIGTQIRPSGDRAMQCDRTRVAGDIRLIHGFRAEGEVRLLKMQLEGSLDLTAACISAKNGRALDLAEAAIGGSLFILDDPEVNQDGGRPSITGRIEMGGAKVYGHVHIRNALLIAPPAGVGLHDYNAEESAARTAILAQRLTVHDDWLAEGRTEIHGGLNLHGADIKGGFRMEGAVLRNAGDTALDLAQAKLGSRFNMNSAVVSGTIKLANTRIGGPLSLSEATLDTPMDALCVEAIGVQVAGDVWLGGLTTIGGRLNFRSAVIDGLVFAEGATLTNPGGRTLSLHQAKVAGNVLLSARFTSVGQIVINRAVIDGRLRCDGATLEWQPDLGADPDNRVGEGTDSVFEAISAVVRSGIGLGWTVRSGTVDFRDARTSYLADDPSRDWPQKAHLTGFVYERFAPVDQHSGNGVWDAQTRIAWLRGLQPFDPLPWEHVAHVLRTHGDVSGAERVLMAQKRRARRELATRWRRSFDAALDFGIGYGYRPQRALLLLAILVAAVFGLLLVPSVRTTMTAAQPAAVVTLAQQPTKTTACGDGRVRCLEPFLYAIDTVVPLIDLGQRTTWYPSGHGGRLVSVVFNVCTILGWFASTIFALSITRLVRSRSS